MAEEVIWMSSPKLGSPRRRGVFVLSLYEEGPGELHCMTVWPGGAVRTIRALEIAQIMAQGGADMIGRILERLEEAQQGGAFDEDGLAAGESEGVQGTQFDAPA